MALSQTDLDNLKKALASGRLTVEIDGRRVTYRSVAELKDAIAFVEADLAKTAGTAASSQSFASFDRE